MRALVGIDGSQGSLAALGFVVRLMAPDKDEIVLYYSPPPVYVRAAHDASGTAGSLQSHLAAAVRDKALQQLSESWQGKVQTIIGEKAPRDGLLIAADEQRADLIVLGARGAGPLTQPTLGSVARHVVHHATIPVLIVRGSARPAGDAIQVLLASDGSEVSRHASDILHHLSWPTGTTGRTITVAESTAEGRIPVWLVDSLRLNSSLRSGSGILLPMSKRKRVCAAKPRPGMARCLQSFTVANHSCFPATRVTRFSRRSMQIEPISSWLELAGKARCGDCFWAAPQNISSATLHVRC